MRLTPGNGLGGALDCGDEGRMITDDDEQEGRNQSAASARSNTSLESTVAAATRRRPILVEPNLVRELGKVVRILRLPGQRVPSNRLESSLDIYSLFSGNLVVRDVILRLAPRLCSFRADSSLRFEIHFVAKQYEREILRITRARLDKELISPRVETLKRRRTRHIKRQHTAIGPAIERDPQRLEALLTGRVPCTLR